MPLLHSVKNRFFFLPLSYLGQGIECESLMGLLHERGGRPFRQTRLLSVVNWVGFLLHANLLLSFLYI